MEEAEVRADTAATLPEVVGGWPAGAPDFSGSVQLAAEKPNKINAAQQHDRETVFAILSAI